MYLTDEELAKQFPFGFAVASMDEDNVIGPIKYRVLFPGPEVPVEEHPVAFHALTEFGADNFFPRQFEQDAPPYYFDRHGEEYRMFPLPEKFKWAGQDV